MCGVVFFLAVAAAPHRHLNPIEDLLSDGPSDSGLVLAQTAPSEGGEPLVQPLRILDDDPCLACFLHDFVGAAAPVFVLSSPSTCLARIGTVSLPAIPEPATSIPASRSPPSFS